METKQSTSTVRFSELEGNWRLDAEYYQPHYLAASEELQRCGSVSEVIEYALHPTEIKREYSETGLQLLLAQNVRRNYLDFSNTVFVPEKLAGLLRRNRLRSGDVLMVRTGANFGDTACYDGEPEELYASAHLIVIRPSGIEGAYLSTYFNTDIGRQLVKRGVYGSSQPEIAPAYVETLPVPRNNVVEREIVELVRQAREAQRESKRLYRQAEQRLLDELGLSDIELHTGLHADVSFSEAWGVHRLDAEFFQPKYERIKQCIHSLSECTTLGDLGTVTNGDSPREYVKEGVPVIRAINLRDLDSEDNWLYVPPKDAKSYLKQGDVLISAIGFGSIGKVGVVEEGNKYTTVPEVIVVRTSRLDPFVLQTYLSSTVGQAQLERPITGSTGQLHLFPWQVAQISVPIPSDDLQQEIARLHIQARATKRHSKKLLEQAKRKMEALIESEAARG